jgi:hypothetical protein
VALPFVLPGLSAVALDLAHKPQEGGTLVNTLELGRPSE